MRRASRSFEPARRVAAADVSSARRNAAASSPSTSASRCLSSGTSEERIISCRDAVATPSLACVSASSFCIAASARSKASSRSCSWAAASRCPSRLEVSASISCSSCALSSRASTEWRRLSVAMACSLLASCLARWSACERSASLRTKPRQACRAPDASTLSSIATSRRSMAACRGLPPGPAPRSCSCAVCSCCLAVSSCWNVRVFSSTACSMIPSKLPTAVSIRCLNARASASSAAFSSRTRTNSVCRTRFRSRAANRSSSMREWTPGAGWRRSRTPLLRTIARRGSCLTACPTSCRRRSVSRICLSIRSACHGCEKDVSVRVIIDRWSCRLSSSRFCSWSRRTAAFVTARSFCMLASSLRWASATLSGDILLLRPGADGVPGSPDGEDHAARGASNTIVCVAREISQGAPPAIRTSCRRRRVGVGATRTAGGKRGRSKNKMRPSHIKFASVCLRAQAGRT
eukprot:scaffold19985_cov115-Isochrysis_galbana.AAC.7